MTLLHYIPICICCVAIGGHYVQLADKWPDQYFEVTEANTITETCCLVLLLFFLFLFFSTSNSLSFSLTVDSLLHTFVLLYSRCIVLPLFCTFVVSSSHVAHFAVAHFLYVLFSLFHTFVGLHVLFFLTFAVLYCRFF